MYSQRRNIQLQPRQEAKLAEVVRATISEISQFLDPTQSDEERRLIERLRNLRQDVDITDRDVETVRKSIMGLTEDINEVGQMATRLGNYEAVSRSTLGSKKNSSMPWRRCRRC